MWPQTRPGRNMMRSTLVVNTIPMPVRDIVRSIIKIKIRIRPLLRKGPGTISVPRPEVTDLGPPSGCFKSGTLDLGTSRQSGRIFGGEFMKSGRALRAGESLSKMWGAKPLTFLRVCSGPRGRPHAKNTPLTTQPDCASYRCDGRCKAIVLPARKTGFWAGCRPGSTRESRRRLSACWRADV